MSHEPTETDLTGTEPAAADEQCHVSRERTCLRCAASFKSEWSGERICARCKGSESWRRGSPMQSHPTRPNRS